MQTARNGVIGVGKLEADPECAAGCVDHSIDDRNLSEMDAFTEFGLDGRSLALLDCPLESRGQDHLDLEGIDLRECRDRLLVDDHLANGHFAIDDDSVDRCANRPAAQEGTCLLQLE